METEPRYIVSYKEYKRLDEALKLVLEHDPSFQFGGMPPGILYMKLIQLGLYEGFMEQYKKKQDALQK